MQVLNMFPTHVWVTKLDIDNKKFLKRIYKFVKTKESTPKSSVGGYQGHEMDDIEFCNKVGNLVQRKKDLGKFFIYNWVNINKKGHKNSRHSHFTSNLFMSGVYYAKVPENSGRIRFYDPRGHIIRDAKDTVHFFGDHVYQYIVPQEGMLLFFPTWLEHDVEENESDEDRVSVSFNIRLE